MDARSYIREKLFNLTMSKVCQLVVSVHEIKSGKFNKKAIAFPYRPQLILIMQNVSVLFKKIKQQMQEIYRRLSEKTKDWIQTTVFKLPYAASSWIASFLAVYEIQSRLASRNPSWEMNLSAIKMEMWERSKVSILNLYEILELLMRLLCDD